MATDAGRLLRVESALGEGALLVRSASVLERMGGLFRADLTVAATEGPIDAARLMGTGLTLRVQLGEDRERFFSGFATRVERSDAGGEEPRYRVTLSPWLWFLTNMSDCRVFQNLSVPEIVLQVCRDRGFSDFRASLSGTYPKRDYCVQYRESDFNFVSRLMEHEGISYWFEHENGKHTMVLGDSAAAHKAAADDAQIAYGQAGRTRERGARVWSWREEHRVHPGEYRLKSFDYMVPPNPLEAVTLGHAVDPERSLSVYDYSLDYAEQAEGQRLSRVRAEERNAQRQEYSFLTDARGVRAGSWFELTGHPEEGQNRRYLVTSANYRFESAPHASGAAVGPAVQCAATAIRAGVAFRPARSTSRPVIRGPQTATVVGKSGERIWTDSLGRIKVQFHWDRYGAFDEQSSCWVRVAQSWAGKRWGALQVPRLGQEVVVEFLEGDPDRPLVTGCVYNGDNRPPYALPEHATFSGVKTQSVKDGAGFNELRFEDKAGEEQVFLHAQKNLDVRVTHDRFETVGHCAHTVVEKDRLEHVKSNAHQVVDSDRLAGVGKDDHLKVTGKRAVEVGGSLSLTVGGNVIEVFKADQSQEIGGNLYLKANTVVIEAMTGITLKAGANHVVIDAAGVTVKGAMVVLDGAMVSINSGPGSAPAAAVMAGAVAPAAAEAAQDADTADPGEVEALKREQAEAGAGKYSGVEVKPFKPGGSAEEGATKTSWVEIELVDEADQPVPGARYRIDLPDGSSARGTLDEKGRARVEGCPGGECTICFPDLDRDAWEPL